MTNKLVLQPWDRMPGESEQAWAAFVAYRDMGRGRSQKAAREAIGKPYTKSEEWSVKYSWVERAHAWDVYVDQQAQAAAIDEIRRMQRRHVQMALKLQKTAGDALDSLDPRSMGVPDVLGLAKLGTQLEREARGATEVPVTVNVDADSAEDAAAIVDALRKSVEARIGTADELE